MATIGNALRRWVHLYGIYIAATLLIMAPLLGNGYILTLDMVGTPRFPMPEHVTNSYLFNVLLHALSAIVPSQIIQKGILIAVLLLSSIGMHRLIERLVRPEASVTPWALYAAGLFFAINPFTYGRFMAGQYAVLLGYALLPWLFAAAYAFMQRPSYRRAMRVGLLTSLIAIVSVHTLGIIAVLSIAAAITALCFYRAYAPKMRAYGKYGWLAIGIFAIANSYWLVPLLLGKGRTAETIGLFTSADISAFATTGSHVINQAVHIARLQGFWVEGRELFIMPQSILPLWGLIVLGFWVLLGYSFRRLWQTRRQLAVFTLVSTLLASSVALGLVGQWGYEHIPFLAGFREPHKFVAILALADSICIAVGIASLLNKFQQGAETRKALVKVLALLLPVLLVPSMFWGFAGQLRPRQYPADWYAMNQQLNADKDEFTVLFLPWHQYMSYHFSGRIIASPADPFFDKPVIVSDDPELGGAIATTATGETRSVDALLKRKDRNHQLGSSLKPYNVKYVILAKDLDYRKYDYLNKQSDLRLIKETATLKLYRNEAWRP